MDKGTNQIELSTSAKAAGKSTAPSTVLNHGKTYERRYQNQTGDSTAVQVAALQIYITERDWTHDGFVSEFRKVPNETSSMHVSKHRTSWPKNRYCNLWTYDYNRVLLDSGEDGPLDYINASHVTGYNGRAYVAAQGPIETTVVDTWRMIWKLKTNRVVMLTKLFHCGMNVCEIYWPPHAGTHKDFGMFEVTTLSCDICSDYTIRTFLVTCQGESRRITHFHFTSWPDAGVPANTNPLLAFRRLVRSYDDRSTGPIIVHCSGGVGRTGTFIALDNLLDMGQAEGQVDVFSFVCHLRTERMYMVETYVQYVFLYHALLDGLQTGHLAYPVSQYQDVYRTLCLGDDQLTELKKQFQMLESFKSSQTQPTNERELADDPRRRHCNDAITDRSNQLQVSRESRRLTELLSAVSIDSFRKENGHLLVQIPSPDTVAEFWRLVFYYKSPAIVLLEEVNSQGSYGPNVDVSTMSYKTQTVTLSSERNSVVEDVVERVYSVCVASKPKRVHQVKQYQLMSGWPKTDRLPSSNNALQSLIELVNRAVCEDDHSGPVILQCMNGASRCGLFCAASHLIGSLTIDQYVDVFHSVQQVRNKRPQAIESLEEYKFLHTLAAEYLSQHST